MAFLLSNAVSGGRRAGLLVAFGAASGMVIHTIMAAAGLAALFERAPTVYTAIRYLGALYLALLAVQAFRRSGEVQMPSTPAHTAWPVFWRGLLNNLANPKIVVFYVAFLPQFIDPMTGRSTMQFLILGGLFTLIGLVLDIGVGLSAGRLGEVLQRSPQLGRYLDRFAGGVFALLAGRLILETWRE